MYFNKKIIYITEDADWVIKWIGEYIERFIWKNFKIKIGIFNVADAKGLSSFKDKILHFGSRSTFLPHNYKMVHNCNKIIFTWFHGTEEDKEFINALPAGSRKADIIHTASSLTRKQLIKWGVAEEKIVVIPLGVDRSLFRSVSEVEKQEIREKLGIPKNSICIGSFQKDGNGWGEGNTPKLIKGPDIFCKVIEKLKKKYPIFVLLTGPARGYVKNTLSEIGVPFKHYFLEKHLNISDYYHALDYYMITSRTEGGPIALLECFASGIPFVTTRVGMVDDIIINNENSLVSEVEDFNTLAKNMERLMTDRNLKEKLVSNGLKIIYKYDWENIARQYYYKIYSRFL